MPNYDETDLPRDSAEPRIEGYTTEELIGQGGSAQVWAVRDGAGDRLAAKVFHRAGYSTGRKEWRALERHAGPHVMPVRGFVTDQLGRGVLLMPLLTGGALWDVAAGRHGLTCGEVVTALAPIAGALAALHSSGAIHGDVTPRNILFDATGRPVLTDLGARRVPAVAGSAEWGSVGYVAPEVLDGLSPTSAADMFGLGACAWYALTGETPQIAALRPRLSDIVEGVGQELADAIQACLSITPTARPSALQFERVLAGAARPQPIPIDKHGARPAPDAGKGVQPITALHHDAPDGEAMRACTDGDGITRRLRDEAQRQQLRSARRAESAPRRVRPRVQKAKHVLPLAAAATVVLGVALGWPGQDGGAVAAAQGSGSYVARQQAVKDVASPQSTRQGKDEASATSPTGVGKGKGTTPAADNSGDLQTINRLLACRAQAWNALDTDKLTQCLATGSGAHQQDNASLESARINGARYSGVGFVAQSARRVSSSQGSRTYDVVVTQAPFDVRAAQQQRHVAEQTTKVRLTLTGGAGLERISTWAQP